MKKETFIKAVKVEPGKPAEECTLKNELSALQDAVSIEAPERGIIELVSLDDGVDIMCHEEGKLLNLPPNRRIGCDIICGTFYVVGVDNETGELISLTPKQLQGYLYMFREPEMIDPNDVKIMWKFIGFDF